MIQQLPQVVSGLLGIVVVSLAAYWIYLNQIRESIGQQIDDIGRSIVRISESYPYNKNPFWMGSHLLDRYREEYPNKKDSELFNQIGNDLLSLALNPEIDKDKAVCGRLSSYSNDGLPNNGRIFFYLMYQYFEGTLILRPGAYMPYGFFSESDNDLILQHQLSLFPFGPVGIETWMRKYKEMRNPFKILFQWRDIFLRDYESYLGRIEDPNTKAFYEKFKHREWIDKVYRIFLDIEEPAQRIESLLKKHRSFSTNDRIPHLGYILALCALSFALGVILPLVHLSVSPGTNQVPLTYNLILLLLTFIPLPGAVHIFAGDLGHHSRFYQRVEYLDPLKHQVQSLLNSRLDQVTYGHENATAVLNNADISISRKLRKATTEYIAAVDASNAISRSLAKQIADALTADTTIRAYKAVSSFVGGAGIPILHPLDNPGSIACASGQNVVFESMYQDYVNFTFILAMPHDQLSTDLVNNALRGIYLRISKTKQFNDYEKARSSMRTSLANLGKIIENELKD